MSVLVIFVAWEGTAAALARQTAGVGPSTLCHGLAIFALASGA